MSKARSKLFQGGQRYAPVSLLRTEGNEGLSVSLHTAQGGLETLSGFWAFQCDRQENCTAGALSATGSSAVRHGYNESTCFYENLRLYAKQYIIIDLDVGVKFNCGKLGNLLARLSRLLAVKKKNQPILRSFALEARHGTNRFF